MSTLAELNIKLRDLRETRWEPRVRALQAHILDERAAEIKSVEAQIAALRSKRPAAPPRWPENTPANVLEVCRKYWDGTTEFTKYRIHAWNDKIVVTSYPGGKYFDNGGGHYGPPSYEAVSLTESQYGKPKRLADKRGRVSKAQIQGLLTSA